MNKEYEYSFVVDDFQPIIDYCNKNGYALIEDYSQTRTLFRNKNKTLARITVNEDGGVEKLLDFKEDKLEQPGQAVSRKETLPLKFTDEKALLSILEFLDYKKDITLKRYRKTFEKGEVKFEIDSYISPEKKNVVAIEGKKECVDKIFSEIKNFYSKEGLWKL